MCQWHCACDEGDDTTFCFFFSPHAFQTDPSEGEKDVTIIEKGGYFGGKCFSWQNHIVWWRLLVYYYYMTYTAWLSPWYNHTGWLGVKHQVTYLQSDWGCRQTSSEMSGGSLQQCIERGGHWSELAGRWICCIMSLDYLPQPPDRQLQRHFRNETKMYLFSF